MNEKNVEQVAKAIYKSMVDQVRAQVAKADLQLERQKRVFHEALQDSDRSSGILIFALAEDLMRGAFSSHLNHEVKGGWEAVFEGNGVLATAADRITMIELLRWATPETCREMRILKSIRNRFAHHADVSSFEDCRIKGWVASLNPIERPAMEAAYPDEIRSHRRPFTSRELFVMRGCSVVSRLAGELAIGPPARAAQVSPAHVHGENFDSTPENLQDNFRQIAELILRVSQSR